MTVEESEPVALSEPTTVALVLGSGGARGYAHIGVLQVLQEAGAEVIAISGSSMGALVGGMLAAGKLDQFTDWATGLGHVEVIRLMDVSLSGPGAIRGERVFSIVGDLLDDIAIEDLPIPYTAVAVDLIARREVWFQEGPLDVAIRASSAIPSFFAPMVLNGRVYVDGGVLNPLPVAPVASARADLVVGVSLDGHVARFGAPVSESADEAVESEWSQRFRVSASRWFDKEMLNAVRRRFGSPNPEGPRSRRSEAADVDDALTAMNVVQASYETMQGALTRHRLAGYSPDVLMSIPKNACRTLDFHRADEMIALGRSAAIDALADHLRVPAEGASLDVEAEPRSAPQQLADDVG